MGPFDLNLSTRPFRAYRLQTLLLAIALVVLVGLSVVQVAGFRRYSSLTAGIRKDAQAAQVESQVLGRQLSDLESKLNRPEAVGKISEIQYLNNIIARKAFSWSRIFSDLEELMPESVHLISLRPEFPETGTALIHIEVRARTVQDWAKFAEALQSIPAFDDVIVSSEEKKLTAPNTPANDVDISFTVKYHPEKEGQ